MNDPRNEDLYPDWVDILMLTIVVLGIGYIIIRTWVV